VKNEIIIPREEEVVATVEKRREKVEPEKEILRRILRRRGLRRVIEEEVGKSVLHKFRPKRQRWIVNDTVAMLAFGSGEEEIETQICDITNYNFEALSVVGDLLEAKCFIVIQNCLIRLTVLDAIFPSYVNSPPKIPKLSFLLNRIGRVGPNRIGRAGLQILYGK
jgi:hypothetical protein